MCSVLKTGWSVMEPHHFHDQRRSLRQMPNELEGDEEGHSSLFTASVEVAQAAIAQAASCELCNPEGADWPFEAVLDRVMLFSAVHTHYFMPDPPACPQWRATVNEKTLVHGGITL